MSDLWYIFQSWGRSDKNCGRYRGQYVFRAERQTDRHTLKWFYNLSNVMHCIRQTATWSLPNAVCFKHDNICACAASALILLQFVNLSLGIDSATSISYMTWKLLPFDSAFLLVWRFLTAHAQFRPHYYFWFKIWRHIWIQRTRFPIKSRLFLERDIISATFVTIMSAHAQ